MRDQLHPWLLVLTLLDLGFVQATGVVENTTMLPLFGLALASLRLRRLQRFLLYRVAWNGGVLAVFTLLVHHATSSGLLHMLEDGLALAVLCQVHLINNIGERQRPDLVFFNSFLVAFVTSFFAADLVWCVLFTLHAFVFVPALEVNVGAARAGSLRRTLAIAAASLLLFALLPRDFHRQGFLGDALAANAFGTDLTERIRLDDERRQPRGDDVVLRVVADAGTEIPELWRGLVYARFDGTTWLPETAVGAGAGLPTDQPFESRAGGWLVRAGVREGRDVQARLFAGDRAWLPLPSECAGVQLQRAQGLLLDPKPAGVVAVLRTDDAPVGEIDFVVHLAAESPRAPVSARVRDALLQLPDIGVVRTARVLATRIRSEMPSTPDPESAARATAVWLAAHRRYELPGEHGFASSLEAFLIGSGAGHCEYFATALAIMLRCQGIPCRLVGGYLLAEHSADGALVARSRHAHAWVEALLPGGTWLTLDATPPGAADPGADRAGVWQRAIDALTGLWNRVVGFDAAGQHRLFALPVEHPLATATILALLVVAAGLRRRRSAPDPAVAGLLAALQAARLRLRPGETPRELLARARDGEADTRRLAVLVRAIERHEAARYRNHMEVPSDVQA
ncbi:MAG: transglutaminaseTgpA domain-containing protein [Planctomycetota bacterium]